MPQLHAGMIMPDFSYQTAFDKKGTLCTALKQVSGKTAILFLRFYGCRITRYDILQYTKQYEKIKAAGGQLLVVLQSSPANIAAENAETDIPFELLCDPTGQLYEQFLIKPGASAKEVLETPEAVKKVNAAAAAGIVKGIPEGNPLQLPAWFVIDRNQIITHACYGKSGGDSPDADTIVRYL